jgi:aminocarboxymuconate-semialdehyde decarboxylase
MTSIDVHAHVIPPSLVDAAAGPGTWHGLAVARRPDNRLDVTENGVPFTLPGWSGRDTIEARLARMDAAKVDVQVLSVTWRLFRYEQDAAAAADMARRINDDLSAIAQAHPDRFLAFAQLPLQDTDLAIRELERAMALPGIVGAAVGTDVAGREWDHPELRPFLEAAAAGRALVYVHPSDRPVDARLARFHLRNLIGNPLETTIAIASLIFGGTLDAVPDVKLVFSHAGGYVPFAVGRFDHGYRVRPEAQEHATALPSDYLRRLWYDSIVHSDLGMRHLVDTVGLGQCVMGSDDPADMGPRDPVAFLRGCGSLTGAEQDAIIGDNLARLLGSLGHAVPAGRAAP